MGFAWECILVIGDSTGVAMGQAARVQRVLRRDEERQKRIKAAGIDYEYKPVTAALPPQPKATKLDEID
jgi:hypothetical protein